MKNLDMEQEKKTKIMAAMQEAATNGNTEKFAEAFNDFADMMQEAVINEAKGIVQAADNSILRGRGVRQLTSEENEYYQELIDGMKSSNPKQSLADIENVLPKTVIDAVFEDLVTEHPLLEAIDFQNTSGLIEFLMNKNGTELAVWGTLTDEIVKELTSGFEKVNMMLKKMSAFLPVAKSMLDLGPAWMDRYVRAILGEASANGLESAIITGTGNNMPIGMDRQVGTGVVVTGGVYPKKDTVELTSFEPEEYGAVLSKLAVDERGKPRVFKEVLLIVNPIDYLTRVMPATTIRSRDGSYVGSIFPFPTKVIPSIAMAQGKAILGIGSKYFMGIGTEKSGKVEYSDEYRFLEDERVYLIKLYGDGRPKDNNAFVYLDVTNLGPAVHKVEVTNMPDESDPMEVTNIADSRLASLSVGGLSLSPEFDKDINSYTLATTNGTNTIKAIAMNGEATIEIKNGETVIDNYSAASWSEGENTLTVTVGIDGKTEVYTVLVTKS